MAVGCGGDGGDLELSVDLRTDFAPGIEFDIVRTELATGAREEAGAVNSPVQLLRAGPDLQRLGGPLERLSGDRL